jgi:hypothetical protein
MGAIDDSYIVNMEPRSTQRFDLPGSGGEFYVVVAQFNTTGAALLNAALLEGDGSALVASLLAGVIDFRLPGKDAKGAAAVLRYSTFASNRKVYEQLQKAPKTLNWMVASVGELNPEIFRQMSEDEREELQAELVEKREELEELREIAGDDVPLDPSASNGLPTTSSVEEPATAPDCSTPSNAP